MPIIVFVVFIGIIGFFLVLKLRNSKLVNKIDAEIHNDPDTGEPKTGEVIKKISAAEKALEKKAANDEKEAERLQKDASNVGDFLASRGVVKPDKGKGETS